MVFLRHFAGRIEKKTPESPVILFEVTFPSKKNRRAREKLVVFVHAETKPASIFKFLRLRNVFEKLCFRDGVVRRVGLCVEIMLCMRFQIFPA